MICGAVNGVLIAYVQLSPFVVTLGMLSIARSLAIVLSQNKMIYEFGPDGDLFNDDRRRRRSLGLAHPVWMLVILAMLFGLRLPLSPAWGRHLFAIGGNEQAARLTGVPVDRDQAAGLHRLGPDGRDRVDHADRAGRARPSMRWASATSCA